MPTQHPMHGTQRSPGRPQRRQRGFTLVELIVATAIIGILVAIAMPQYGEYVRRTHRANARAALNETAQWMERVATAQGRYPTSLPSERQKVEGNNYRISLKQATSTAFVLIATRQGGNQNDKCGNLTLSNTGVKGVEGATSGMNAKRCWGG